MIAEFQIFGRLKHVEGAFFVCRIKERESTSREYSNLNLKVLFETEGREAFELRVVIFRRPSPAPTEREAQRQGRAGPCTRDAAGSGLDVGGLGSGGVRAGCRRRLFGRWARCTSSLRV